MLRTTVDTVCTVISLAEQWTGKVPPNDRGGTTTSRGEADDPGDDDSLSPMIAYPSDHTPDHLEAFIRQLGEDEQADLLALLWVGRGDFAADDWEEACDRADEEVLRSNPAEMLMDSPHLAGHLTEALEQMGYDCPEDRADRGAAGPGESTDTGQGME